MYNLPEMRADNARFWEALRELLVEAGLRDPPERLTFDRLPVPERIGPEVFFSQTCGYPATARAGLSITDIVDVPAAAYRRLLEYEREAAELGYPELA
jgi:hypothetical protein